MKRTFVSIISLLCGCLTFAQTLISKDFVKMDTTIFVPEINGKIGNRNIKTCLRNDTLMFVECSMYGKSTLDVFIYSAKSKTYSIFKIAVDEFGTLFDDGRIALRSIDFNDKYLAILSYGGLIIFDRRDDSFRYLKTIPLSEQVSSDCDFLPNGKLLLSGAYLGYEVKEDKAATLCVVNIESGEREKEIHPPFSHPLLTFFQDRKIVNVTKDYILYAQTGDYTLIEYDFDLNKIDSEFTNPDVKWDALPKKIEKKARKKYQNQPADVLSEYMDWLFNRCSRIFNVYVTSDDTKMFVFYGQSREEEDRGKLLYDVWVMNDKWALLKQGIVDGIKEEQEEYGDSYIDGFIPNLCFGKDYILRISKKVPISRKNMTWEEYNKLKTDYLVNNNYVFCIETIKFNYE